MYTPAIFEVDNLLQYGVNNLLVVVIKPAPHEQPQEADWHLKLTNTGSTIAFYVWLEDRREVGLDGYFYGRQRALIEPAMMRVLQEEALPGWAKAWAIMPVSQWR